MGPTGNSLTPPCTPLHVYQLVYLLLQDVFRTQPDPWPFPLTDDFETTKVGFDTIYNKNSQFFGKKPLIVVSRGPQSASPISLSDRAATNIKTMNSIGTSIVRSSIEVKVISKEPAEVDILGQHVFNVLQFCRVMLAGLLNITAIDSVSMSHVALIEQEDHMYFVSISMPFQQQYKWSAINTDNLLASIGNSMNSIKTFILN